MQNVRSYELKPTGELIELLKNQKFTEKDALIIAIILDRRKPLKVLELEVT